MPTLLKLSRFSVTVSNGHKMSLPTMMQKTKVIGVFPGSKFPQVFIFQLVGGVQSELVEQVQRLHIWSTTIPMPALLLPDAKRAVSLQISVRMCYHSGVRFAAELFYLNSMQQKETLDYVWSYYQRLNGSLALNESTIISEEPGDFHRFRSCIEDCTLEMALESEFHEASSCTSKWWRIVTASFLVVSNYLHLYSPVPAT